MIKAHLYAWPESDATDATRAWFEDHQLEFVEHDGSTAMHIMIAQELGVRETPMVVVRDGDQVLDVYGGYHPERLEQLLSPSL